MTERAPISVVIPAYNSEDYLRDAIESVLAQSLPVIEIIVVDDGSTDGTSEIAKSLGALVIRQENRGVSAARNVGIRAAVNEWIAFIDQDDLWAPQKIECQWAAIQLYPDVGIVSCNMTGFADESIRGSSGIDTDVIGALAREDLGDDGSIRYFHRVKHELPLSRMTDYPSSVLVRRDLLLSVGMFDESLRQNEDLECFLRVIAQCPLAVIQSPLVQRRIHSRNASLNNPEEVATSYYKILDCLRAYPHKYPPGAARAYNKVLSRGLITAGRMLLEDGRMRDARALLSRSLGRIYSGRAIFLWCLTFLSPGGFKHLLTIKRKLL
jgi:glycosyltransferase involved in cell wall biosynthesis